MAVDPNLRRIREVGADLIEPRPEVGVQHVEVVDADPALGHGIGDGSEFEPPAKESFVEDLIDSTAAAELMASGGSMSMAAIEAERRRREHQSPLRPPDVNVKAAAAGH